MLLLILLQTSGQGLEDVGWKVFGGLILAAIVGGAAYIKKGLRSDWEKDQQKATEELRKDQQHSTQMLRDMIETKLDEYTKGRKERDEQFFQRHREQDERMQQLYRETEARFARIEITQEHDKRDIREIAGSLKSLENKLDNTKDELLRAIIGIKEK